ncbi:MAG: carbamoyl-phosphate synthase large subunit [Armatimonadetes bacterium]|nr:carbamoyl-phosphate synthase large subunit [Armatimonadota bacterium]
MLAPDLKKVMLIGSGPIVIGQAAEFDYSGTQACRALKEEGLQVVLINSNPATIMTDAETADRVYIEPLTVEFAEKIIAIEKPDGLLPNLGGQTGLNLAADLATRGILQKHGVRLLGAPLSAIQAAEDRERFRALMREIGEPVPESWIVESPNELKILKDQATYPLIVRPAYTLGGTGGGVARDADELMEIGLRGLQLSPRRQILVERSLLGWKEIEYEVVRDANDNAIIVCNMENLDPMGVHTGDSIVVAPSQTLSDFEYQLLRSASLKIIRALQIQGGCNVQLALNPYGADYYVIEVNPRVSRSSALASKATGYPIARIAAKISVGYSLDELRNPITGTSAAFEPALDYVVVKIPRFPFDKFPEGDRQLGTQMKATGEAMAIDRTFEGAMMKAVRSLEAGTHDLRYPKASRLSPMELENLLTVPTDERLFFVAEAFRRGMLVEEARDLSGIDPWFLNKIRNLVEMEQLLLSGSSSLRSAIQTPDAATKETQGLVRRAKAMNMPDSLLASFSGLSETDVRRARLSWGIRATYKMVDTCAGEFAALTPYYYSSYSGSSDNEPPERSQGKAIVVGSGPIRIGQGIEFDYSAVHAVQTLREAKRRSIIINSNPETVSTDFDSSDALYFDPLAAEDVLNLIEHERLGDNDGLVMQFGGQTAINLTHKLEGAAPILGTSPEAIDIAEDRDRFDRLLLELGVPKPPGRAVHALEDALEVGEVVGYPVLVRPSYVLGGRAMEIVRSPDQLRSYWSAAVMAMPGAPVLVDRYIEGKEAEVDLIGDGEDFLIPGIMEHIERAGVHSGDSMTVYPPQTLTQAEQEQIVDYSLRIAKAMRACGIVNIQFVLQDGQAYVIEVNPRASRTAPYLSKVTGIPMISLAMQCQLGLRLSELTPHAGLLPERPLVAVKAPVFSSLKLANVDTVLGPEMKSTGEVMGVARSYPAALFKAMTAAGMAPPRKGAALLTLADADKEQGIALARALSDRGFRIYATRGTAKPMARAGVAVTEAPKIGEGKPDIIDLLRDRRVQALINSPSGDRKAQTQGWLLRRAAIEQGIPCITSLDTAWAMLKALDAPEDQSPMAVQDY